MNEQGTLNLHEPVERLAARYTYTPSPAEEAERAEPVPVSERATKSSWAAIDLAAQARAGIAPSKPTMMHRSDGVALLYPGRCHGLAGEPEALKTWLAAYAGLQTAQAGGRVLYIDYESSAGELAERLVDLGAPDDALRRILYIGPLHPADAHDFATLRRLIDDGVRLVVIDGLTEAFASEGLDVVSNRDTAVWMAKYPRRIAALGPAVLLIDHLTKSTTGRGRYALGAGHKLAAVDAQFELIRQDPFGRGQHGSSVLLLRKDRPGAVRRHCVDEIAGVFEINSVGNRVTAELQPPTATTSPRDALAEQIVDYLANHPDAATNDVTRDIRGRAQELRKTLDRLVKDGTIERHPGRAGKQLHRIAPSYDSRMRPASPLSGGTQDANTNDGAGTTGASHSANNQPPKERNP